MQTQQATAAAPQAATGPQLSNVPDLNYYREKAKQLGTLAGQGKNCYHTMLTDCLKGGFVNALTFDPRQGEDEGDQAKLASDYATAQGLANSADPKAPNMRKIKSEIGLAIKTGGNPRFSGNEPVEISDKLVARHDALKRKQVQGLLDKSNMLLRFWRHINNDKHGIPSESDLDAFCYKAASRPMTAERVIGMCLRTLEKLSVGKLANCNDMDDSKDVKDAVASLRKRAHAIVAAKTPKPTKGGKQPQAQAA